MNLSKVALVSGLVLVALMGGLYYLNSEKPDQMIIKINSTTPDLALRLQLFQEWTKKYKKTYGRGETAKRFAIWNQRYEFVEAHNAKGLPWKCGMNKFADLTREEFSALYTGFKYDPNEPRNEKYLEETNLAKVLDWRDKGAVTEMKDQGECGSCYAFSASGALEALYKLKKGRLIDLSNGQLLDCTRVNPYKNYGCTGGSINRTFNYTRDQGIMTDKDYPYVDKVQKCKYDEKKILFKNSGYTGVPKNNPAQLKAAVSRMPVAAACNSEDDGFALYMNGTITEDCSARITHSVLIIGYGEDYWIVKNSWGDDWGLKGYGQIAMGMQNNGRGLCGINSLASYPDW